MSRAAKLTFGISTAFAVGTAIGVYYLQEQEREALKQGPIKDQKRLDSRAEMTSKQRANLREFELQKKLKEELEATQPLTGDVIQGLEKGKE
ncbi:Cytochrome c oxidase assembly protein [Komagataella phaffii CBS 7435]|uniref:Uncharacterized protein n=2 Tax=Komagataella phaffii TaxID=460519 RepID=C4QXU9_KOMPG|nr:Hypothetical protein PAS_chr1-4_0237 [Komagataella phaffii GS115]KAI0464555.1 hypothetical protein LJB42_002170 [Komagataella kurtzmanii]CAH2446890.1 Cytochrome c oxidase assembly protein [Komagataella phaffii CBS 7435]CAY68072.1 Hypothetical protein PAS_chr1-4_0237 [Komagataella phaffii GS115]SCV11887.1 Cytochrome c oxidase assembly protein [Komagataella phaffii CBS 7435]